MSDSSSDAEALSDGFEFDEDEDDVRQRALMSGPAQGSLTESEARARKRRVEEMEVPFPMCSDAQPTASMEDRRSGRVVCSCAHCGDRLCRSARTLRDEQVTSLHYYGRLFTPILAC
eukprot:COSAG03_NODE_5934_length_1145_cov_2.016252_2_plen_117_part_00